MQAYFLLKLIHCNVIIELKNAEMIIDGYFYISMTIIGLLLDYEIQEYFLHFSTY